MGFSFFSDLITPTKYSVPTAPTVDLTGEQKANAESNTASFKAAKELAQQFNDFMSQQVQARLKQNMPYMQGLEDQAAANYAKQLRGEISDSDAASAQRRSAARALGSGMNVGALTARDLGLTQFQVQNQAQQGVTGFLGGMAQLKNAPLFDFSNIFMSPSQRIGYQFQNKENDWKVQNMKNQMAVQPEPWMRALAGLGDSLTNYATSAGGIMGSSGSSSAPTLSWDDEWNMGSNPASSPGVTAASGGGGYSM